MGPATAVVTVFVVENTRCVIVALFLVSELTLRIWWMLQEIQAQTNGSNWAIFISIQNPLTVGRGEMMWQIKQLIIKHVFLTVAEKYLTVWEGCFLISQYNI